MWCRNRSGAIGTDHRVDGILKHLESQTSNLSILLDIMELEEGDALLLPPRPEVEINKDSSVFEKGYEICEELGK